MTSFTPLPLSESVPSAGAPGALQRAADVAHYINSLTAKSSRLVARTIDGRYASGAFAPSAGSVYIAKMDCPNGGSVSSIEVICSTAGVTGGANCYLGVYDSAGNELGVSAESHSSFTSTGIKVISLVTPIVIPAAAGGYVYVSFMIGTQFSGTAMQLREANGTGDDKATNFDQAKPPWNAAIVATGASALPSTITLIGATSASALFLAGLS